MILIQENLRFIEQANSCPTYLGKLKYELGGRAASLSLAVAALAEAIFDASRFVLKTVFSPCFFSDRVKQEGGENSLFQKTKNGLAVSLAFLFASLSFDSFQTRLLNGPIGKEIRENRIRSGGARIEEKLKRERKAALDQMNGEKEGLFNYLRHPNPVIEEREAGGYRYGVSHSIGRRKTMEDEHLAASFDVPLQRGVERVSLFAIFDGHAGKEASSYLKENLEKGIERQLIRFNRKELTDEGIWNALKMTFVELNRKFQGPSGSTAIAALVIGPKLWIANVGDSRAFLQTKDQTIPLSEDAKPSNPRYQKGIVHRGGWIEKNHRLNGVLSVARSLGDHQLGAVSARPKIIQIPLAEIPPGSRLVLGCDGIYEVASTKQIGAAVRQHQEAPSSLLAQNIVYSAYQAGSWDNLSAMVVQLDLADDPRDQK